jgi:hypothetical protein
MRQAIDAAGLEDVHPVAGMRVEVFWFCARQAEQQRDAALPGGNLRGGLSADAAIGDGARRIEQAGCDSRKGVIG